MDDVALTWMTDGFDYFAAQLGTVDDTALAEPSALPGWTRKHVVSHVGFNARNLVRLVHWARTGEVTPMYPGTSRRSEELAEGARWSGARLRAFVHAEQRELAVALKEWRDAGWSAGAVTGRGRAVDSLGVPWLRAREVWIHAVDLNAGGDFSDFPPSLVDRLIVKVMRNRRAKGVPALDVHPTDRNMIRPLCATGSPALAEGAASDLARWLTREDTRDVRTRGGTPLPELGPWL